MDVKVTKICKRCEKEKYLHEFNKQSKAKDGYKGMCRICDKEYNKNRYALHHMDIKEKVCHWQKNNRPKVCGYKKKYYRNSLKRYVEPQEETETASAGYIPPHSPEGQN